MAERRARIFPWIYTASGLFYLLFILRTSFVVNGNRVFTLVDDAMISMRYARHWAEGHGLVWNIGEPPVEGFSNPAWTGVMTLIHLLPVEATRISLLVMILSGAILILNLHVVRRIAEHIDPEDGFVPVAAVIASALCFPLVFWSLRGMEVGVVCLLVNTGTLLALRAGRDMNWKGIVLLGLVAGGALAVRVDAGVSMTVLVLAVAGQGIANRKMGRTAVLIGVPLACLGLLTWFRASYFGELLPNTYYLKMTGLSWVERSLSGARMFFRFSFAHLNALVLLVTAGLLWKRIRVNRDLRLLIALFLVPCLYSMYAGGDFAEFLVLGVNRFVAPGLTAVFILTAIVIRWLLLAASGGQAFDRARRSLGLALATGMVLVMLTSGWQWGRWVYRNAPMLKHDIWRTRLGLLVEAGTTENAVIAVNAAGQIPYYSRRTAVDLLGRSDKVIARSSPRGLLPGHNKWDYQYSILGSKPDVMADAFEETEEFLSRHPDEYQSLSNGIWILKESLRVDREALAGNYGQPLEKGRR